LTLPLLFDVVRGGPWAARGPKAKESEQGARERGTSAVG